MAVTPRKYTDPIAVDSSRTLGRKLIPTADLIRDLHTRFGMRPYKMRVVRVRWTGGKRGVGTPDIESALDILPTPKIMDLAGLTEIVHPVGLDEDGTIMVTEISGRFTDEDLRFARADGTPPGPDEEVWYEIEFPRPDGKPGDLRRFYLRAAPMYYADRFQWQIRLEKAHSDRARNGDYRQ
jgi:hypothetical protein